MYEFVCVLGLGGHNSTHNTKDREKCMWQEGRLRVEGREERRD